MRSLQTMNAPEHSKQNRRLGLILGLLFVGLFAVVTATIVTGSKTPPIIEKILRGIGPPILGGIGLMLIIGAIAEVVFQVVKRGESVISNLVAPLLGTIGLLLIIAAIVETGFQTLKVGEGFVSDFTSPIILGTIGLLLVIGAVIGIVKRRLSE